MSRPVFHIGFPSPSISTVTTPEWADLARRCEAYGFDTLWHSNERFFREMWIRMTAALLATERMWSGAAVVEPYAVHPALSAQALATASELSGGRATVAVGAGGAGFRSMGVERRHPLVALREAFAVMRGMLEGEVVTLEGEQVIAREARLHFPPPRGIPLWLASRGDRILQFGGAVADGVMVATYADPPEIAEAVGLVRSGMVGAGRADRSVRIMSRVETCVHDDPELARQGCRLMVAKLLWGSYPDRRFVERAGLRVPDEMEAFNKLRDYDRIGDVAHLVPDEFIDKFCWVGTPMQVADRISAVLTDAGVGEVGIWLLPAPGQTLYDALDLLAGDVLGRVTATVGPGALP